MSYLGKQAVSFSVAYVRSEKMKIKLQILFDLGQSRK